MLEFVNLCAAATDAFVLILHLEAKIKSVPFASDLRLDYSCQNNHINERLDAVRNYSRLKRLMLLEN